MKKIFDLLRLDGKVGIITGGAGLLGIQHAHAIAEAGAIPILWDIRPIEKEVLDISRLHGVNCDFMIVDISNPEQIKNAIGKIISKYSKIDILINNAANDPKVVGENGVVWSRLENFSVEAWHKDIAVGLTGAFLCSREIGKYMADHGGGVILNIASDLGIIAPDQRIYRKNGLSEENQPVKPVTYSVIKHGIIGLTKYLATYWANKKVRVNALSPGGVFNNQPLEFLEKLTNLIPMGRMAAVDEYKSAVVFLCSEASSYMTGTNLIIDGGRTTW